MKKFIFVMPLMAISLLASCGNKEEPKDEGYEVTFSVPNDEATILYGGKTQIVKQGEVPTKPKKDPYRVGYKFTGWYKDEECSEVFDFEKDHIEGATTLYSGWEEDPKFAIPLCFTSNVDDNIIIKKEDFYYKTDLNDNWEPGDGSELELDDGEKVYIGSDNKYNHNPYNFALPSGSFNASGNIMSLINHTDFKFLYEVGEKQFYNLFRGHTSKPSNIVDADDLLLPATKLAGYCYQCMFDYATSLVKAPQLPASTLTEYCYKMMFDDCTALMNPPELPATTLADNCYEQMFCKCSFTKAPELPATTLADCCYINMFLSCPNLIEAPILPATTLSPCCYEQMFYGCEKLNYVKVGFGDGTNKWPDIESCTSSWLDEVSATGTFVWRGSLDGPTERGRDTVPSGWTIETY